ncbi:MAG TPA: DUF5915 domain-containing protein, partial [Clostridia bacterium]|nr:DUF5915 domain-containing protein [Clostridia bacterium]
FIADGANISLSEDDVLLEPVEKAGLISASERELSVVLDTNLTKALIDEGLVRELTSKLQMMRKEAGFDVTDHIIVRYLAKGRLLDIFARFSESLKADTLAAALEEGEPLGFIREWDINGEPVTLGITRV